MSGAPKKAPASGRGQRLDLKTALALAKAEAKERGDDDGEDEKVKEKSRARKQEKRESKPKKKKRASSTDDDNDPKAEEEVNGEEIIEVEKSGESDSADDDDDGDDDDDDDDEDGTSSSSSSDEGTQVFKVDSKKSPEKVKIEKLEREVKMLRARANSKDREAVLSSVATMFSGILEKMTPLSAVSSDQAQSVAAGTLLAQYRATRPFLSKNDPPAVAKWMAEVDEFRVRVETYGVVNLFECLSAEMQNVVRVSQHFDDNIVTGKLPFDEQVERIVAALLPGYHQVSAAAGADCLKIPELPPHRLAQTLAAHNRRANRLVGILRRVVGSPTVKLEVKLYKKLWASRVWRTFLDGVATQTVDGMVKATEVAVEGSKNFFSLYDAFYTVIRTTGKRKSFEPSDSDDEDNSPKSRYIKNIRKRGSRGKGGKKPPAERNQGDRSVQQSQGQRSKGGNFGNKFGHNRVIIKNFKNIKDKQTKQGKRVAATKECTNCGENPSHDSDHCWILHPELRPVRDGAVASKGKKK